jgi:hypothetical protein
MLPALMDPHNAKKSIINCSKPETNQCHMQRNICIKLVSYHLDILISCYLLRDKKPTVQFVIVTP